MSEANIDDFGTKINMKASNKLKDIIEAEYTEKEKEDVVYEEKGWAAVKKDIFTAVGSFQQELTPGVYKVRVSDGAYFYECVQVQTDDILEFRESFVNEVIEETKLFWSSG